MANTRAQTLSEILANIFQNNSRAITGAVMQTVLVDMANAYANLETDVVGLNDFSATKQYVSGNAVVYDGMLYQANQSHLGAWNAAHFTEVLIDIPNGYITNAMLFGGITASKLVGSDITTVGIITTGTWNGSQISTLYGGTGISSYDLGDTLYGSSGNNLAKLAGNITTTKKFLSQTGNGSISAAPIWTTLSSTDVGLGNVENTALSTWSGSTNLTTLGIITAGTWNGTAIADSYISSAATWNAKVDRSGDTMTGFLTLNADPVNALHAATKSYIDNLITGLTWKSEVACATTANITLSGEQTIDGILTSGSRVLVKDQTVQTENGLYVSDAGAWSRSTDADTGTELVGATVFVGGGSTFANTQWTCSNTSIIIGITNVTFSQIAGAGTYTNGTGLTLVGNVFSIDSTVATLTGSQTLTNKTLTSPIINVGSDATGDMYYRNSGVLTRLQIGTSNQLLSVSGGVPTWQTITTTSIYTGDSTIADNSRIVTLKTGTTSGYNLQFKNSAGKIGYYFDGTSSVGFLTSTFDAIGGGEYTNVNYGDSTNEVAIGYHLATTGNKQYSAIKYYTGSALQHNVDSRGFYSWYNMTTINTYEDIRFSLVGNSARITTSMHSTGVWQDGYRHAYLGTPQVSIGTSNSYKGQIRIYNDAGNDYMWNLEGQNGNSYTQESFAVGVNSNTAARFTVKGSGSTAGTVNALFKDSSNQSILTLLDDRTATFASQVQGVFAPNIQTVTSASTITANSLTDAQVNVTALAVGATIAAPSNTPKPGQKLMYRFKDNGTAQTLTFNAIFRAIGVTIPTTTVANKTTYVACEYNSTDNKWDVLAVGQEA